MSDSADTLGQSDEDFLKQAGPSEAATSEEAPAGSEETGNEAADDNAGGADADADAGADSAGEGAGDAGAGEDGAEPGDGDQSGSDADGAADAGADGDKTGQADADGKVTDPAAKDGGEADDKAKDEATDKTSAGGETFSVPMAFKANGKEVKLKNEGEALTLMQLGANYTKRMQELAPHRKMLMMLQNNDLMDESKLSFLIDLDKKNPEAIKKLIADAGIDPLEIDTSVAPDYQPGNHTVSDEQARFRTVVEEISSTPAGKETVLEITRWDQTSKDAVWASPEIMATINEQRESGVYDLIRAEIERRETLGSIPAGTPFLESYSSVGQEMAEEAAKSAGNAGSAGSEVTDKRQASPKVAVTTRVAEPKPKVANGDKAAAAAPSRAAPGAAKTFVNPLAQGDDEFLKSMEGRV